MTPWKGISAAVLEQAGVHERDGLIVVPYRRPDGSLFRERLFAPNGRAWWEPGDGLSPYGLETLPPADQAVETALLIAEGESDALALREAFADRTGPGRIRGYRALGLPGATSWRPEWKLIVEPHALIYVLGDGDDAGQRMNISILEAVPWARAVWLPDGEDARGLLQQEGPDALDPYLRDADHMARVRLAFRKATSVEQFRQLLRREEA
jgi:hypothetical protein